MKHAKHLRYLINRSHFDKMSPKKQETHQVDSLLDRRQKEDTDMSVTNLGGFMTMTFLGYYDKVEQSYPQMKEFFVKKTLVQSLKFFVLRLA